MRHTAPHETGRSKEDAVLASRVAPLLGLAAALSLAGCTDAGSRSSAMDRPAVTGAPTPAAATTGAAPDGSPRPSPSSSAAEVTIPLHSDGVGAVYLGLPQAQAHGA